MRKGLKHLRKSGAAEHSRKSSLKNLIIAQEAGTARSKLPLQFLPDTSDAERGNDQIFSGRAGSAEPHQKIANPAALQIKSGGLSLPSNLFSPDHIRPTYRL
jgi:hypothetical protein